MEDNNDADLVKNDYAHVDAMILSKKPDRYDLVKKMGSRDEPRQNLQTNYKSNLEQKQREFSFLLIYFLMCGHM